MGSNTFRLVVFRYRPGGSFQLVDEIRARRAPVGRRGPGRAAPRRARARRRTRPASTRAFCAAAGSTTVAAVATSAVRDARQPRGGARGPVGRRRAGRARALGRGGGLVRLPRGGQQHHPRRRARARPGRRQRPGVAGRGPAPRPGRLAPARRRAHDRGASCRASGPRRSEIKALRRHVARRARPSSAGWRAPAAAWWASAARSGPWPRCTSAAMRYPLDELHGYILTRARASSELIDDMAAAARRRAQPPARAEAGPRRHHARRRGRDRRRSSTGWASRRIEICSQGLREGVFYERFLAPADPPLMADVRRQSVLNLVDTYRCDVPHAAHVCRAGPRRLRRAGAPGPPRRRRRERELLWAAGMLHDAGVLVDYNDHHKHGYYLVLNAGLPGYRHPELAMIALLVRAPPQGAAEPRAPRGHRSERRRRGPPARGPRPACLRIAEQLERGRAGGRPRACALEATDGAVRLIVRGRGRPGRGGVVGGARDRRLPARLRPAPGDLPSDGAGRLSPRRP